MVGRQRVEAMVQTLASLGSQGESLAEVAHDARNMVTALGLYCDLLEEPGVLAVPFAHYGNELRLVASASRRLVEKLVALEAQAGSGEESGAPTPGRTAAADLGGSGAGSGTHSGIDLSAAPPSGLDRNGGESILDLPARLREPGVPPFKLTDRGRPWESLFAAPVNNLAAELLANRNLLSALAGPGIAVTVDAEGGARPVRLTGEDLTRLLVNLVKNAAEAIPQTGGRGHIQISLREPEQGSGAPGALVLAVEDNGSGIPPEALNRIFEPGFSTHARTPTSMGGWPAVHRGLGLSISRSLVEASGGRVTASNREPRGARIEIELPVRAT